MDNFLLDDVYNAESELCGYLGCIEAFLYSDCVYETAMSVVIHLYLHAAMLSPASLNVAKP